MLYENIILQQETDRKIDMIRCENLIFSLELYSQKLEKLITTTCNIEKNLTKGYK